jgi:hypothetical protein
LSGGDNLHILVLCLHHPPFLIVSWHSYKTSENVTKLFICNFRGHFSNLIINIYGLILSYDLIILPTLSVNYNSLLVTNINNLINNRTQNLSYLLFCKLCYKTWIELKLFQYEKVNG